MICLPNVIPALRVKDITIFDLLDQEFHYGEFVVFPKLAAYLGRIAGIPKKDAQEIGRISELVYLYAKVHSSVKEGTLEDAGFRSSAQMPILLGDLFLGRFYRTLAECEKENCLPVYLDYMKALNSHAVDCLEAGNDPDESYRMLLAKTVAQAIEILAGDGSSDGQSLQNAAEIYLQEQWPLLYGERITTLAELDSRLQAEMF